MVDPTIKQRLAELEAATPNLMDLSNNPEWQRLSFQLEAECDGEVGAGYDGQHLGQLIADPVYFTRIKRLQKWVVRELANLLTEMNLGVGLAAALACGRKIVIDRLAEPSWAVQQELWTILDLYDSQAADRAVLSARVRQVVEQTLTADDWGAIAQAAAASVQAQVLAHRCLPKSA
jgi:hypothetical protein